MRLIDMKAEPFRNMVVDLADEAQEYAVASCESAESCQECRAYKYSNCRDVFKAEFLDAHGVTVLRWIPVTERKPDIEWMDCFAQGEDRYRCLVWYAILCNPDVFIVSDGWYDGEYFTDERGFVIDNRITHWMPLPPAPEDAK